jgi:hypothetical protein
MTKYEIRTYTKTSKYKKRNGRPYEVRKINKNKSQKKLK